MCYYDIFSEMYFFYICVFFSEEEAKKKKKKDFDDEAFEESDDGDEEGRELDYISDSSDRFVTLRYISSTVMNSICM
jgi:hypothetical protein